MQTLKIENKFHQLLVLVIVSISLVFINIYSLVKKGGTEYIWFEAEDALSIRAPMEIVKMEGASGDKGIFTVNDLWLSRGTGFAVYKLKINNPGKYVFWGRVYWPDACSNAFQIELNKDHKYPYIFGNDPILNTWLWSRTGNEFSLKKGINEIKIYKYETGARLDKFLLTTDKCFVPVGMGLSSEMLLKFDKNDNFHKSIDFNNVENWKIDSVKSFMGYEYALRMINLKNDITESFNIDVSKKPNFVFGLNFKILKSNSFELILKSGKKNIIIDVSETKVEISIQSKNHNKVLHHSTNINYVKDGFNQLCIDKSDSLFWIKIDENMPFYFNDDASYDNIIVSSNTGGIFFDDITLCTNIIRNYFETFHFTQVDFKKEFWVDKKNYLANYLSNNLHFLIIDGEWDGQQGDIEILKGRVNNDSPAKIVFGSYLWKDYSFDVAINLLDKNNFSIIFNYQNEDNFYQCLFQKQNENWKPKLVKVSKGKTEIIDESTDCRFIPYIGYWEHVNIINFNDSITISLNDNKLFSVYDSVLNCGKLGFGTESKIGCNFDNIILKRITNSYNYKIINSANYKFQFPDKLFMDLASWRPLDKNYVKVFQDSSANDAFKFVGLEKKIGENVFLSHRKLLESDFTICFKYYYFRRDIIPAFHFTCYKDHQTSKHSFLFENNQWIYKINSEIIGAHINRKKRLNNFNIKHKIDKWMIFSDEDTLSFSDLERKYDSIQFSFGYEGIGYAQIPFPQIEIQNLIEK